MGTNNFYYKNASKAFVVFENVEEKFSECGCGKFWEYEIDFKENKGICANCGENITHDTEYHALEDFMVDDEIDYFKERLKENGFVDTSVNDMYELRSFPSRVLLSKNVDKYFGNANVHIQITAILRSGYYEAACLDWQINTYINNSGEYTDEIPNFIEDFSYEMDNKGMAKIQAKYALKWFEKTKKLLISEIENIFTELSTPYNKVGGFSDGTALYQKV